MDAETAFTVLFVGAIVLYFFGTRLLRRGINHLLHRAEDAYRNKSARDKEASNQTNKRTKL